MQTQLTLSRDAPASDAVRRSGKIVAIIGGLHHQYFSGLSFDEGHLRVDGGERIALKMRRCGVETNLIIGGNPGNRRLLPTIAIVVRRGREAS